MSGVQSAGDYFRFCPGEEHIKLSNAVCRGRRRIHYPKCAGCQFNDDEKAANTAVAPASAGNPTVSMEGLFGPEEIIGEYPRPLTQDVAWRIGHAAGQFLQGRLRGVDRADPDTRSVVVGRDLRPHSAALHQALIEGICSTGLDVIDLGPADTPQVYFAVSHLGACGGIAVTAGGRPSHLGGFVICAAQAVPVAAETGLTSIRDIAERVPRHITGTTGTVSAPDLATAYRDYLRRFLPVAGGPVKPVNIVVNANGGVAGAWYPRLFDGLDDLRIELINSTPDCGAARHPDPFAPPNLSELRKAVRAHRADFGVALDAGASRCSLVDERSIFVPPDLAAALIARRLMERESGASVVCDHRFNTAVWEEIDRAGGAAVRERSAPARIKKTMHDRMAVFGADLSGRYYFREHAFCESATMAIIQLANLVAESGRRISEMVRPLARYRTSGEVRFRTADPPGVLDEIASAHGDAEIEHLEGVTVRYSDWWFNVRSDESDGALALILEAPTRKRVEQHLARLTPLLGTRL